MKALFFICLLLAFLGMPTGLTRKYIYVSQSMNWTSAQNYCRQYYMDLATITSEEENQRALNVTGQFNFKFWIGLNRTKPHAQTWQWSDGEQSNFTKWCDGEPNDSNNQENCAAITQNGWNDIYCQGTYPSICYRSFMFVKESKTWEEALRYCRTHKSDLASVNSDTLDLFKSESKNALAGSVWTGLCFLNGKWFWLNGMPQESLVSLPICPVQHYRCGAYNLNRDVWENRDCNEELNFLCFK